MHRTEGWQLALGAFPIEFSQSSLDRHAEVIGCTTSPDRHTEATGTHVVWRVKEKKKRRC